MSSNTASSSAVAELSDAQAGEFVRRMHFDMTDLRAPSHHSLWACAAMHGRTDICRWLASKGMLDMINDRAVATEDDRVNCGTTPLMFAMCGPDVYEHTARWMIENGARVDAVNDKQTTVFSVACKYMPFAFVKELADKVGSSTGPPSLPAA